MDSFLWPHPTKGLQKQPVLASKNHTKLAFLALLAKLEELEGSSPLLYLLAFGVQKLRKRMAKTKKMQAKS